jgi:hypothetical protein
MDYVCCTVQYPNSWFLKTAMQKNSDKLFKEWVVLYVDLSILKFKHAKFCPCNASKCSGAYIDDRMDNISSIFATSIPTFQYQRPARMLDSCPTDGQAEILIKDNIPREYIVGIAVGSEDVAERVYAILKMYNVDRIPIYLAPDILTTGWSRMIRNGCQPEEIQRDWPKEE